MDEISGMAVDGSLRWSRDRRRLRFDFWPVDVHADRLKALLQPLHLRVKHLFSTGFIS